MRLSGADSRDLFGVDVDSGDAITGLGELDRQRKADVAHPDHADAGGAVRDALAESHGG